MNKFQPGTRIAAVQWLDVYHLELELAGYGCYMGRQLPDDVNITLAGISAQRAKIPIVCAQLDNGIKVYATEFNFVPEETIKNNLKQFKTITNIDKDMILQRRSENYK